MAIRTVRAIGSVSIRTIGPRTVSPVQTLDRRVPVKIRILPLDPDIDSGSVAMPVSSHVQPRFIIANQPVFAGTILPLGGRQAAALGQSPRFPGETSNSDHKVV